MLKIVWFSKNLHSEMSIDNKIHYFIGGKDRYNHRRNLSYSISNSHTTPVVLFSVTSSMKAEAIYGLIQKEPPSKWNTCMGSIANIVKRVSDLSIPLFLRQSPELSALYLIGRHYVKGDVCFETLGISKAAAIRKALILGGAQCGLFAFSSYMLCTSAARLSIGDQFLNNIS